MVGVGNSQVGVFMPDEPFDVSDKSDVLSDRGQRYKRNALTISAAIIAVHIIEGVTISTSNIPLIDGLSEAALWLCVAAILAYNLGFFIYYAHQDYWRFHEVLYAVHLGEKHVLYNGDVVKREEIKNRQTLDALTFRRREYNLDRWRIDLTRQPKVRATGENDGVARTAHGHTINKAAVPLIQRSEKLFLFVELLPTLGGGLLAFAIVAVQWGAHS